MGYLRTKLTKKVIILINYDAKYIMKILALANIPRQRSYNKHSNLSIAQ